MCANLTSDGMFLPLFFNGKGVEYLICENNRKSIKNMHCIFLFTLVLKEGGGAICAHNK